MTKAKTTPLIDDLRAFPLFRTVPEKDIKLFFDALRFHTFEKGELIIQQMDNSTDFYLLFNGTLLVNQYSSAGREVSYRHLVAGQYFGELAALDGAARSVSIMAMMTASVGCITASKLSQRLESSPALCLTLLTDMAARVRDLSNRLFTLTTVTVPYRIDAELLRIAINSGIDNNQAIISPIPNHSELAALVGAQREAVTREITRLVDAGLIIKQPNNFILPDIKKLVERVETGSGESISG